MKTFKEFLTEGRDAPLYHATKFINLKGIIKKNTLQARIRHGENGPLGVSLTRNFKFAKTWRDPDFILELDQKKLSQRYKILPIDYFGDNDEVRKKESYNFYEEFVIGDIKNIDKYIIKIWVNDTEKNTIKKFISTLDKKFKFVGLNFGNWD